MHTPSLAGWLDQAQPEAVSGWAADMGCPDTPATLAFILNGQRVAVTTCERPRADAVAAGFSGARAFHVNLKPWLADGANVLEVVLERSQTLLPNGRQVINVGRSAGIGDFWSSEYAKTTTLVTRWWECEYIVRRINQRVCGQSLPGLSAGLHQLAKERFGDRIPFARGVSIGCGTGHKERGLIQSGVVQHFTLFELSGLAVEQGRAQAADAGLAGNMTFRMEDGLATGTCTELYDVVYWNNALHHMFDVKAALEWSHRVLRKGGVLLMDDFVGPTRMHWSDNLLSINTQVRQALPPEYLRDPRRPGHSLPIAAERPPLAVFMANDPSECVDSGNILPELMRIFPDAWVQKTGGGVYHLALNDVLHNIVAAQDFDLLERILQVDDECTAIGETHYAVAIAVKS